MEEGKIQKTQELLDGVMRGNYEYHPVSPLAPSALKYYLLVKYSDSRLWFSWIKLLLQHQSLISDRKVPVFDLRVFAIISKTKLVSKLIIQAVKILAIFSCWKNSISVIIFLEF